jgi:hypothetical protein
MSLTPERFVAEVIDKAGITRPPYAWFTFEHATWLADAGGARPLVHGLPEGAPPPSLAAALAAHTPRLAGYLVRHQRADGLRDGLYQPLQDRVVAELDLARQIHGAWSLAWAARVLGGAELEAAARQAVDVLVARVATDADGAAWVDGKRSVSEVAFLLLALCELERDATDELARRLARGLWQRIDRHGKITSPELPAPTGAEPAAAAQAAELMQDFLPGQVLAALAAAVARGKAEIDGAALARAFAVYRHRFRYQRGWGQVSWLGQAAAAWWRVTRDAAHAELAFEIADFALEHQLDKNGGFVNETQPDGPGCTTGVFLEAVAAALGVAGALGDTARAERYRRAAARALDFLDGLIYQQRDRPLLPAPERAYGGVRQSLTASHVRVDFVHHALNAFLLLRDA